MLDIENTRSDTSSLRKDVMARGSGSRSKKKEDDKK
jgi:hypothetical protein